MTASDNSSSGRTSMVFILGNGKIVSGSGLSGLAETDAVPEYIHVGEGETVDLLFIVLPGNDRNVSVKVDLSGQGAEINVGGAYICLKDENFSISTEVNHKVSGCCSRQLFKGIAGGRARTGFSGRIIVAPDAQKTEAYQENHNLLLSDDARVDTRPELEIYADDVKCSHGATVGRLDEEALFYMRSRGISEKEARMLQILSFLAPVADMEAFAPDREQMVDMLSEALMNNL